MWPLALLVISLIIATFLLPAEATSKINAIGIDIEKSCKLSSKCAKYSTIIPFDNATKIGKLVKVGDDYKRIHTVQQNNPEWLRFTPGLVVIVDPPSNIIPRIKMIHIVSNLDEYHHHTQMNIKESNTTDGAKPTLVQRTVSHTRSVDEHCRTATIGPKNLSYTIKDTISYLAANCSVNATKIATTTEIKTPITKHDIGTTAKAKMDKFYEQIKKECLKARNSCDIINRAIITNQDTR